MRSEFRRQLDLKTLQIEESIKVGRREIGTLERALQEASTQKVSHEQSFRKVKERILGGHGSEPVALQALALKGLGTKLKGEAEALSTLSQKMQILQIQKKAKSDSIVAQNNTLEKIRVVLVSDDRLQSSIRESADLENLVEVGGARNVVVLTQDEEECGVPLGQDSTTSVLPEPSASPAALQVATPDNVPLMNDQRDLSWSTDSRPSNERLAQGLEGELAGKENGSADSSIREFQEQIERMESWSTLSNSGVDLTYVSDTGARIGMQIVGGNGIPVRVVLTPQTAADHRTLFNQKKSILESLRSKGVSVRDVVVSGGDRS